MYILSPGALGEMYVEKLGSKRACCMYEAIFCIDRHSPQRHRLQNGCKSSQLGAGRFFHTHGFLSLAWPLPL